jgi:hypothetical protein
LNTEAQRIAIAEACPEKIRFRRDAQHASGGWWQWRPDENHGWRDCYLNDILQDLNAMHEAENTLTIQQMRQMAGELDDVMPQDDIPLHHATATQRAEAFLRIWK